MIHELPYEILIIIFQKLLIDDFLSLKLVNKKLRISIKYKNFWKEMLKKYNLFSINKNEDIYEKYKNDENFDTIFIKKIKESIYVKENYPEELINIFGLNNFVEIPKILDVIHYVDNIYDIESSYYNINYHFKYKISRGINKYNKPYIIFKYKTDDEEKIEILYKSRINLWTSCGSGSDIYNSSILTNQGQLVFMQLFNFITCSYIKELINK